MLDDLTAIETRVHWQSPTAIDNSGVTPKLTSNRASGSRFSVPGSYEVVYKAVDGSGNEAMCSFRITLKRKYIAAHKALR